MFVDGVHGSNGNNGQTWGTAKKTVAAAIAATASGNDVWVKAGIYPERITLKEGVKVYGGFRGTEEGLWQRQAARPVPNTSLQETILDGQHLGTVVTAVNLSSATFLDGFTIRNGNGTNGGGISLSNCNVIIANCFITENEAHFGAGIHIAGGAATVVNCVVLLNQPSGSVNHAGGIATVNNFGQIINNVIAYNGGHGIYIGDQYAGTVTIANNILYQNYYGLKFVTPSYATPLLRNNNIVGFQPYDGIGAGAGDIDADPMFVSADGYDFHLQPTSPCVNAGWSAAPMLPPTDMDGHTRSSGAAVDIGPDEYTTPPAIVYVNGAIGNDNNTGDSWQQAKKSIADGINMAGWGSQVWVANGNYQENIFLKPHVSLYGGMAGFEIGLAHRYPFPRPETDIYRTNITGNGNSAVVSCINSTDCHLDGFTLTGGSSGQNGALYWAYASGIIENCIIENNPGYGVALSWNCEDTIIKRSIIRNNGDTGILSTGGGEIRENLILNNGPATLGGGIFTRFSGAQIINNTIVGNIADTAGGIYVYDTPSEIRNNIVAFNTGGGVYGQSLVLAGNNVYGHIWNYSYGIDYSGDIQQDPLFVDAAGGNYHLKSGSPCIDAGTHSVSMLSSLDIDGESRIINTVVDIGADEYHTPKTIYVKKGAGSDSNSGLTWALAKATITGALSVAFNGDQVWVAKGSHNERITLPAGVKLYGGFVGNEASLTARPCFPRPDPDANASIIEPTRVGIVVTVKSGATSQSTTVDGFTIRGGESTYGGGISCINTSPLLVNNTIEQNESENGGGIYVEGGEPSIFSNIIRLNTASSTGGGIFCRQGDGTSIWNNSILENTARSGGGVGCEKAGGKIWQNLMISNSATTSDGGGIYCYDSDTEISHNIINGNTAVDAGGGIRYWYSSGAIVNNNVAANAAAYGGGIHLHHSAPLVVNNTITGNTGTSFGGGLDCFNSPAAVSNNIVALNWAGIGKFGTSAPTLTNNNVWGNVIYQYWDVTAGTGDISVDPLFVDWGSGNYHLQAGSGCINAGWNSAPGIPLLDLDGQTRKNGTVDIGADEYWLMNTTPGMAKALSDGMQVTVTAAVTAVFGDIFYIETVDRASGIRVQKTGHGLTIGQVATVEGLMSTTSDDERYIAASNIVTSGSASIPPLKMQMHSLGGADWQMSRDGGQRGTKDAHGLNTIGLLAKVSGKVTSVDAGNGVFYISDSSVSTGVRVKVENYTLPTTGQWLTLSGVVSCYKSGSDLYPLLRLTAAPVVGA